VKQLLQFLLREHGHELHNLNPDLLEYAQDLINYKTRNLRMSPWAKENIFQLWCKGHDFRDIS